MNRNKIYFIILMTICSAAAYYLCEFIQLKKTRYYANGGFQRKYLAIHAELKLISPNIDKIYRFSSSTNHTFAIGFQKNTLVRITYDKPKLKITTLSNIPIFPNNEYFSDDENDNIYILSHQKIISTKINADSPKSAIKNIWENFDNKNYEPVIFNQSKIICFRRILHKWDYQFQNTCQKQKIQEHLTKLVDQGKIQYHKPTNTFIYVSLFSNDIVQYNSEFKAISRKKTIDTITTKPQTKEVKNTLIFASPPRVSNYDFFILRNKLFVRSIVKSDEEVDFEKKVIFDIYDINRQFSYLGSIYLQNKNATPPLDIHLLSNNTLLVLYEDCIEVHEIRF